MKLVYYPVFTRVKKLGIAGGMAVSTAAVFFVTWITHAYQSFWTTMDANVPMFQVWDIFVVDSLFWGLFGLLVIINSLFALKRKPVTKSLGKTKPEWSFVGALRRALQIAAMFVLMCLLWSLWQSKSLGSWVDVISQARQVSMVQVQWLVGLGALGVLLGIGGQYLDYKGIQVLPERPSDTRATFTVVVTMVALTVFGWHHKRDRFAGKTGEIADAMRGVDVRQQAQIDQERGYYEELLSKEDGYAAMLRGRFFDSSDRPDDFPNDEQWVRTGDVRHKAYQPNAEGITVGMPWRTNQWGMRDREYTKEKPPEVYRIAVMGASYTMGRGIREDEDFESQLEALLNEDGVASKTVEVLNFATTNYTVIENAYVCQNVIPDFQPDALFLVGHGAETLRCSRRVVQFATDPEVELSFEYLKEVSGKANLDPQVSEDENIRRIKPYAEEILQWSYQTMGDACRANGIKPVWVFLATTKRIDRIESDVAEMMPIIEKAGFVPLVIEDPYRGRSFNQVVLNRWDAHPNKKAHRGIALQLLKTMRKEKETLGSGIGILDEEVRSPPSVRIHVRLPFH